MCACVCLCVSGLLAYRCVGVVCLVQWLPFFACLEATYPSLTDEAAKACADKASLSWDVIDKCANSPEGKTVQTQDEKETPKHSGVPWVVIDGNVFVMNDDDDGLVSCYLWCVPWGCAVVEVPGDG